MYLKPLSRSVDLYLQHEFPFKIFKLQSFPLQNCQVIAVSSQGKKKKIKKSPISAHSLNKTH